MRRDRPRIVVIGAGMAGLAAAHVLRRRGLDVIVLEREMHVGGRVVTHEVDGFTVDAGAQFITNFHTHTLQLIRDLALQGDIMRIPKTAAVLRSGQLYPLSPLSRLLSSRTLTTSRVRGLARLIMTTLRHIRILNLHEPERAARLDTGSASEYARRHLDQDDVDYLLEPVLASFLYWTPDRTSQAMLFLLTRAALAFRNVYRLRGGMGRLPAALAGGSSIELEADASAVYGEGHGYEVLAQISGRSRVLGADGVVCAVPATGVAPLFPDLHEDERAFFQSVRYAPSTMTAVAVDRILPGRFHAVLFPRREAPSLALAAISSARSHPTRPHGPDMVFLYPSGPASGQLLGLDDRAVRDALVKDLALAGAAYDVREAERFHRVYRWPQGTPEFETGSLQRLRKFAQGRYEFGRVVFAGDYLGGPSIEGAVTSGMAAARRLILRLENRPQ